MISYEYVVSARSPKSIPVADKPINQGGKIEHLAIDEFEKRFHCTYNDGVSVDRKSKITPFNENITGDVSASQLKQQVTRLLKVGCSGLVICNMGESGHGVFTLKSIPKDTVVAIYAGTMIEGKKVINKKDYILGYYDSNISFSTKHHRGIASFIQHLPEEPKFDEPKKMSAVLNMVGQKISEEQLKLNVELYSTEFESPQIRRLVATENVRAEFLNYNKFPLIAMVTNSDIEPGCQLGFNYGYHYWLSRNVTPEFFDKKGNAIAHSLYKKTFGQLNFDDFSYTGEFKPLIELTNLGVKNVPIMGDDKKIHIVSVIKLICLLSNANGCHIYIQGTS